MIADTLEIGKNLSDFLNNLMVAAFIMLIFYGVYRLMKDGGDSDDE